MTVEVRLCENAECGKPFVPPLRSPHTRMCSKPCRNRVKYLSGNGAARQRRARTFDRAAYDRARPQRQRPGYMQEYNRRPEVRERHRLRARAEYVPSPRARKVRYATPDVPRPYSGHRWLEMAREAVSPAQTEFGWELYDRYNDEMGEAVLALLEGGDPREAVKAFRKREFVPRHLTSSISEWQGDKDTEWLADRVIPTTESAEDEVVARENVATILREVRVHWGHGKGMMGTPRQSSPTNRKQNAA